MKHEGMGENGTKKKKEGKEIEKTEKENEMRWGSMMCMWVCVRGSVKDGHEKYFM